MKVGIFSPYLDTLGGGERYVFTVAEYFLKRGDKVDIFNAQNLNSKIIKERFNLDISSANFLNIEKNTLGYDLFFFLSDGSIPFSFAKKNILHFQVPFKLNNGKNILNKLKLSRFNHVVCNSNFTKKYIDRTYGINSEVLYPPVDINKFYSGEKENIILSVGRFFSPSHPKKQEVLIKAFTQMKFSGWQLVLIGGGDGQAFRGKNIKVIANSSFGVLQDYYSRAKIYWHAAGFGEDLEKNPDWAEHFGITTVEAMAAGCVPVVFAGGGQLEIVNNKNGFLWKTVDDLKKNTQQLIEDENIMDRLSKQAIFDSKKYSKEKFYENLAKII